MITITRATTRSIIITMMIMRRMMMIMIMTVIITTRMIMIKSLMKIMLMDINKMRMMIKSKEGIKQQKQIYYTDSKNIYGVYIAITNITNGVDIYNSNKRRSNNNVDNDYDNNYDNMENDEDIINRLSPGACNDHCSVLSNVFARRWLHNPISPTASRNFT